MRSQHYCFSNSVIFKTTLFLFTLFLLTTIAVSQQIKSLSEGRQAYVKTMQKAITNLEISDAYPPSYGEAFAGIERYEHISDIQTDLDFDKQTVTITVSVFVSNPDNNEKDYGGGEHVNVWIDWNENGTFEKNEQVLDQINYAKGVGFTGTLEFKEEVNIPENAPPETWIRIVLGYGFDPGPIDTWYYGSSKTQMINIGRYVMGEITSFYLEDASSNLNTNSTLEKTSSVKSKYIENKTLIPNLDPYHGFWSGEEFIDPGKYVDKKPFQNNKPWDPTKWDDVKISFEFTTIKGLGQWEWVHIGIYKDLRWWNYKPIYKKYKRIKLENPSKPKLLQSYIPGKEIASLDKGYYYLVVAFKRPILDYYPKQPPEDSYKVFKFKILRWPYYVAFVDEIQPDHWNEAISVDQIQHEAFINFLSSVASGGAGALVALLLPGGFVASLAGGTLTSMLVAQTVTGIAKSDAFWAFSDYGDIRGDITWNYNFRLEKYEWISSSKSYEKRRYIDWYRKDFFRNLYPIKLGYYRETGPYFPSMHDIDIDSWKKSFMNIDEWPPNEFRLGQYPNPDNYTGYGIISPIISLKRGNDEIKPKNWRPEFDPRRMTRTRAGNTYRFEVTAKDPDSHLLDFEWSKSGGEWQGGEPNTFQASLIPDGPGAYTISVKVKDERGGYDKIYDYFKIPSGLNKTNNNENNYSLYPDVFSEFKDYIVDVDGDGFFDSLNISMNINLTDSLSSEFSTYEIGASLYIDHLDTVKVIALSNTITDSANIDNITLNFYGEAIRMSGHNGSFLLKDLYLAGLTDLGRTQFAYLQDAFETKTYQSQEFTPSTVELLGVVFDKGIDLDNDGLFDVLSIGLDINVLKTSDIKVSGLLTDSKGDIIGNEIITVDSIQIGKNSVELNFLGEPFRSANISGPYILKNAIVYNPNNHFHFDTLKTPYSTAPYQSEKFETIPIQFNSILSEKSIDIDNDGLYNILQIEIDVTIVQDGKYNFYGTLVNSDTNEVAHASKSFQLGKGTQKVLLPFNGLNIFNSNIDGPYMLNQLEIKKMDDPTGFSLHLNPNFLTNAYTHSEFQSPPIEITNIFNESTNDVDNDGKHDELLIDFDLQIVTQNEYHIIGSLTDLQDNSITHSGIKSTFEKGTSTAQFIFDGIDIGDSRKDGPYVLDIKIFSNLGKIIVSGENVFSTSGYSYTDFNQSSALFTGVISDSTMDSNGNGLYDILRISTSVQVTDPGKYHIVGKLSDKDGKQISESGISTDLNSGLNEFHLEFSGTEIYKHGKDGPYILSELLLYDISQNTWPLIDSYMNADTTKTYQYTQFERSKAAINKSFTDRGTDSDNNGLFDYLTIEVDVDVLQNGQEYNLDGSLFDKNGIFIQKVRTTKSLDSGTGKIDLNFDGFRVRGHGDASPYSLRHLTLLDSKFKVIEYIKDAYKTQNYDHSKFETSIADLMMLNTDITVSEGWSNDNKLSLKSTVYNFGGEEASSVDVRFLDNSVPIGSDITLATISGAKPENIEMIWDVTNISGNHNITIAVDPDSIIPEINENNNRVNFELDIPITNFPGIPQNVNVLRTDSGMEITWDQVAENNSGYHIYRATQAGGTYEKRNKELIQTTIFHDSDLVEGATYHYVISAVRNGFPNFEGAYSTETTQQLAIDVSLQQYSSKPDTSFVLPIKLGNLMNHDIFSIDIKLTYDPAVLVAKEVSTTGTVAQGWGDPTYSIKPDGQIWIAMAGVSTLPDSGLILNINFDVVGTPGDTSQLKITEFTLNEGNPQSVIKNGSFKIEGQTDVENNDVSLPASFVLHQNYPNPFNPNTTIHYSIPQSIHLQHVILDIYNTLGEKIVTLVDQPQEQGNHSIKWNGLDESGTQVSSGIYLYRLHSGSFTEVKKMLFLQ